MKALVTGGGGFIGKAIVQALRARGDEVSTLARGEYPELTALGCAVHRGDLSDAAAVRRAAEGCDVVFHVAAKAGVWGKREDYERTNILGTEHVIEACVLGNVPRLVFTSSPSVAHAGGDLEGVDASLPYPAEDAYAAEYPRTKAVAEKRVRAANGRALAGGGTLATVALRPHLVWGPGDNHLVPRIVARAKAGRLRIVGDGEAKVDSTYIDNAVEAHLAAAAALTATGPLGGNAYFVSNGEPLPVGALINRIVAAGGAPPVTRHVPFRLAYVVGALSELAYRALGRDDEPMMTRFVAEQLATAHWFDITPCDRDFGWRPRVSIDEGMKRLAAWLRAPSAS
jgi:nucleoside-diphosphate-sugar epimerase